MRAHTGRAHAHTRGPLSPCVVDGDVSGELRRRVRVASARVPPAAPVCQASTVACWRGRPRRPRSSCMACSSHHCTTARAQVHTATMNSRPWLPARPQHLLRTQDGVRLRLVGAAVRICAQCRRAGLGPLAAAIWRRPHRAHQPHWVTNWHGVSAPCRRARIRSLCCAVLVPLRATVWFSC